MLIKYALDAGHGQDNRNTGIYDPGAVSAGFQEADIVLTFGLELEATLLARDIPVFMTRTDKTTPAPVGKRASKARNAGCTHFISLHCNSAANHHAHGIEVLYREDKKDRPLAQKMLANLIASTGMKDRGIIKRTDLAVLKFTPGPAILIELGFISNKGDREKLLDPDTHRRIVAAIADVLTLEIP